MEHMIRKWRLIAALSLILSLQAFANAMGETEGPDQRVKPGADFYVDYPDMPMTLASKTARMNIIIPKDYDPSKKYPLFLWLNGAKGGPSAHKANKISQEKRFICVSFPLFKESTRDGASVEGTSNIYMRQTDMKINWDNFKIMLNDLYKIVPNIDPDIRIAGGFSNGAHTIAYLLNGSDGEFQEHFTSYILWEGGDQLSNFKSIKDRALLLVWGEAASYGEKLKSKVKVAEGTGIKSKGISMPGIGHDCPVEDYADQVREWMCTHVLPAHLAQSVKSLINLLRRKRFRDAVQLRNDLNKSLTLFDCYPGGSGISVPELQQVDALIEKLAKKGLQRIKSRIKKSKNDKLVQKRITELNDLIGFWEGTKISEEAREIVIKLQKRVKGEVEIAEVTHSSDRSAGGAELNKGNKGNVDRAKNKKAKVYWDMAIKMIEDGGSDMGKYYLELILKKYPETEYAAKAKEKLKKH